MQKLIGLLRLARPANIVTAFSDIGAGVAIAYFGVLQAMMAQHPGSRITAFVSGAWGSNIFTYTLILMLATLGLYGGGVVLNDVFDAELDAVERPERPIPSGLISKSLAAAWGVGLLLFGVVCAGLVHWPLFFSTSFFLALATAVAAVLYDAWGKHQNIFGPINMGLCRGLNLLLGMSIFPQVIPQYWFLALVPVVYIAAITMISRGEVHGGKKNTMYGAVFLYVLVVASILVISFFNETALFTLPFVLLFAAMIFPPLAKAVAQPSGPKIGKAVKAGVLSLILMNAAWAAAFGAPVAALCMLLLLPLSMGLAKAFAVT
ncbi:UbiA-like protein EboC [Paracnuella aquatica]|uniref:UbiA-like protein EboC n=1 Tax=Paracnuella aquatica TaxID=2268757 RepID=UPI000DEEF604|nr:UbiA-like protein EboC [Paracnuella aquatica]RPD47425.1 polyprenyltransferase [Paracnuella aquatica]